MFELFNDGLVRRAKYNPLEQLSTFYDVGNAGGDAGGQSAGGGSSNASDAADGGSGGNNDWGTVEESFSKEYSTLNTDIAPATEYEYSYDMDLKSVTTHAFGKVGDDITIESNRVTTGYLDFDFDSLTVTNTKSYTSLSSGSLASHLYSQGVPASVAIGLESLATIAAGALIGAPAIATIASAVVAVSKQAALTGVISFEAQQQIEFTVAILQFAYGVFTTIQTLETLASVSGYLTSTGKLAAVAVTAISLYSVYDQFTTLQAMANAMGINTSDINASDLAGFDMSVDREGDSGHQFPSVEQSFQNLVKWKALHNITSGKESPLDAEDVFDKMAGGVLYNAFFGGGIFFHPLQQQEQNMAAVGYDTVFEAAAMPALLGSERVFLSNTKTTKGSANGSNSSAIVTTKKAIYRKIQVLQGTINSLMDDYNEKLSAWEGNNAAINAISDSYNSSTNKTQASYNETTAKMAAQKAAFDYTAAQLFLDSTGKAIEDATTKANALAEKL